ncbi:hypothetical protein [Mesorhizobium sp. M0185]|uniref:hypothetical protein n=1 Tax=unclassified Mesorhizobium TaxID=325217 RepID=UPI0033397022
MTPKIAVDFGKDHAPNLNCYSVLCASEKTRGAVGVCRARLLAESEAAHHSLDIVARQALRQQLQFE